jgi:hypothetical protein
MSRPTHRSMAAKSGSLYLGVKAPKEPPTRLEALLKSHEAEVARAESSGPTLVLYSSNLPGSVILCAATT